MGTRNRIGQVEATLNGTSHTSSPREVIPKNYPTTTEKYTSCRWRLSYMLTLAFTLVMTLRNCMSFAIVCMTGEATGIKGDHLNGSSIYNETANVSTAETGYNGEFGYSSETQGLLISSVFYAGIISPIVGSVASRKLGPKKVITISMAIGGIVMLITPIAARTHIYVFVVCRVITGFAVTTVVPVSQDFWLYWAPLEEKAQLMAYAYSGFTVASIITFALSGFICLIPVDNGWPFIFYIFGACTFLWCIVWYLTIHEMPECHPSISDKEKLYIISNRSKQASGSVTKKVPWKDILTTKGVWAYTVALSSHTWTASLMLSYLPLYMATVLNFDVKENGVLSAMPYVTRGLGTLVWGYLTTKIVRHLSVTNTRKLVQCVGNLGAAGLSIALCFVGEGQEYVAVVILIISTPFQAVIFNAGIITPSDMAPQYASMISSIGLVFNMIVMISSPLVVSYIIRDRSREQWAITFYLNAAVYIFAAFIFLLFGRGDLQPWADNSREKDEDKDHSPTKNGIVNASFVADVDEITHM